MTLVKDYLVLGINTYERLVLKIHWYAMNSLLSKTEKTKKKLVLGMRLQVIFLIQNLDGYNTGKNFVQNIHFLATKT